MMLLKKLRESERDNDHVFVFASHSHHSWPHGYPYYRPTSSISRVQEPPVFPLPSPKEEISSLHLYLDIYTLGRIRNKYGDVTFDKVRRGGLCMVIGKLQPSHISFLPSQHLNQLFLYLGVSHLYQLIMILIYWPWKLIIMAISLHLGRQAWLWVGP